MAHLQVITSTGAQSVLDEATLQRFKAGMRGGILLPSDIGYDTARKVWNRMVDKRPALIARCAGVADIIQSVRCWEGWRFTP